jgi:tetratricopeptide (TPR) repeat protein
MGKLAEAREEFGKMQQGPQPYQDLGEFYLAKEEIYEGKLDSARSHLEAVIRRAQAAHTKGLQLEAHALLGRIYLVLERPLLAQKQVEQILAAPEADLQIIDFVSAGKLYARAGALAAARQALRRLQSMTPGASTAWDKRSLSTLQGEIALAENAPQRALAAFLAADSAYPQASTHEELALAYEAQHDWRNAAEQWQQLLNARGEVLQEGFPADLVFAELQLARIHKRLGDVAAARQQYEEVLQRWQHSDDFRQRREAAREMQVLIRGSERLSVLHPTAHAGLSSQSE